MDAIESRFMREVRMGVGEAIKRLIAIEFQFRQGLAVIPELVLQERDMIINALNQFELNLGFDCNMDGVPDTVDIFEQSVATSCCRLLPTGKMGADASRSPGPAKKTTNKKAAKNSGETTSSGTRGAGVSRLFNSKKQTKKEKKI